MKICSICKCPKHEECFKVILRKDGSKGLHSYCKPCQVEYDRKYRLANLLAKKDYDQKRNKEARAADRREDRKRDGERIREQDRERCRTPKFKVARNARRRNNPSVRIKHCLRSRLNVAMRRIRGKKATSTSELLGAPWVWVEVHLESLFVPGMTWDNYGRVWHVDHVKPCALFNLLDPEQQKICFHWTNLQPLFAADNLKKGDTYERC